MIQMEVVPLYQHDCLECRFIGRLSEPNGAEFDLYACTDGEVVARFGHGPDHCVKGKDVNFYSLGVGLHRLDEQEIEREREMLMQWNIDNERSN